MELKDYEVQYVLYYAYILLILNGIERINGINA